MTTTTERPQFSRNPIFIEDAATVATTGVTPDELFRPIVQRRDQLPSRQHSHTVVMRSAEAGDPDAWEKPFWRVSNQVLVSLGYVFSIQVSVEQLGLPTDAIASESPWPLVWNQPYPSTRSRPGVLFVTHRRHTIFEEHLVLHTASLPSWKPQIAINRRLFEKKNG